jgi:hypothetical protein
MSMGGLAGCPFLFPRRNKSMKRLILTVAVMLAASTPVFARIPNKRTMRRWLP